MVEVERNNLVERVGLLLASFLAHLCRVAMAVVYNSITFLYIRIRSALEPHVHTKRFLAGALQCWTVSSVRAAVVLPYKVVDTPRIQFSYGIALCRVGCASLDIELGCAARDNSSLDKQLVVVCYLACLWQSIGV